MTDNDLCPADSAEPVYHLSNVEKNILWKTLIKSVVNIKPELADSGNTWQLEIITLRAQVAAGDALRAAMVKLAGTIKNRAWALNQSGDDDFEMLGAHYSGLADEITKAIDASKEVKP